jgi:predicted permease
MMLCVLPLWAINSPFQLPDQTTVGHYYAMIDFLPILAFSFSVTGPIFLVLTLGIVLRRAGMINEAFIEAGSKLVFNVTLPSLLLISISKTSITQTANLDLILYGVAGTVIVITTLGSLVATSVGIAVLRGMGLM